MTLHDVMREIEVEEQEAQIMQDIEKAEEALADSEVIARLCDYTPI